MDQVWTLALELLRRELSHRDFATWVEPLEPRLVMLDGGLRTLVLKAPHAHFAEFVAERFRAPLEDAVRHIDPDLCRVAVVDSDACAERFARGAEATGAPTADGGGGGGAICGEAYIAEPSAERAMAPHVGAGPQLELLRAGGDGQDHALSAHADLTPARGARLVQPAIEPDLDEDGHSELLPHYTFDSFVVGASNQFAAAACQAAAEHPAKTFNPLFIYGGTGLGKTHLLHAIGNHLRARCPTFRITYISSEQYINELIHCIRCDRMDDFRYRYRSECDVLLVDDIQFFAGKERTQYEFFHTFNTLYNAKRQIVVTSDRAPHEVKDLQERLRTRFEWGLIADVQPPEMETRMAILTQKAEREGIKLPKEIAMLLATSIKSNVRVLEGSLNRLGAYAALTNAEITATMAREVLSDVLREQNRVVTIDRIAKAVAGYFDVKVDDLRGPRRHRVVTRPRMVAMYLCRQLTPASYPEIGRWFGGRDHSTVISAVTKIGEQVDCDAAIQRAVRELQQQLAT